MQFLALEIFLKPRERSFLISQREMRNYFKEDSVNLKNEKVQGFAMFET